MNVSSSFSPADTVPHGCYVVLKPWDRERTRGKML